MKEIPKLSIQLNLNYQLIYLVKSIHHYQRINQSKQKTQKKNFVFFRI